MTVADEHLAAQVNYYRRRAAEYDETAYGDPAVAGARIGRLVDELAPSGDVLEIACGTGMWTGALAAVASTVMAIDAAEEAIEIARARVRATNVTFAVADVFSWTPSERFDTIFFAAWLSHVPASRFDGFWRLLRGVLADGGRVLFVDEHADERDKETYVAGSEEIVERRLRDGSRHHLVKVFVQPDQLRERLGRLGWESRIRRDGDDWVVGEAWPGR